MKQIFKGTINTENGSEHFTNASEYHSRVDELLDSGESFECSSNIVVDGEPIKQENSNVSCTLDNHWGDLVSINATPYFESNDVDYKKESLGNIRTTMEKLHKHLDEILSHCSNEELEKYYQEVVEIIRKLNDSYDDYGESYENELVKIKKERELIKQYKEIIDACNNEIKKTEKWCDELLSYREKTNELLAAYKSVERRIVDAGVAQFENELKDCKKHNCNNNCKKHNCNNNCKKHKCNCGGCTGDCENCECCKEDDENIEDIKVDFSDLEKLIEDLFKDVDDGYLKKLKDLREKNTTKEEKYDFVKELEKLIDSIY